MSAVADIIESMKGLTALELVELKKGIEDTFDVSAAAAAPVMVAGAPGAGGDGGAAEEKTEFDAMLESVPADKKIAVLKAVREITGLGLKEAKTMVESAPVAIKEGASKEECEEIKKKVEEAGGAVAIK